MEADEQRGTLRVGERGAVIERGIFIGLPREQNAQALLLELRARGFRQRQRHIFFHHSGRPARTVIRAAMPGIENHYERRALRWRDRRRWGQCRRRLLRRSWSGLLLLRCRRLRLASRGAD